VESPSALRISFEPAQRSFVIKPATAADARTQPSSSSRAAASCSGVMLSAGAI